jgi:hypothetical protein
MVTKVDRSDPMSTSPSRSTRFLTGLATVMLVVGVAFGAFAVVGAFFGFGPGGDEVGVHTEVSTATFPDPPAGEIVDDDVDVAVRIRDATDEQHRLALGRDLPSGLLVLAALWLLRQVLRSVRDGDPFNEDNVRRLRALAFVVLVGVPVALFVSSVFASELASNAGLDSSGAQFSLPGNAVLGGLALFVLAEVFASGVRLRDDLEGTV